MPNFYERVLAIPDQPPAQFSGALPAGSVAGYAPAIPAGQILISVQVKVTQGDLAGWHVLQPNGSAFGRI